MSTWWHVNNTCIEHKFSIYDSQTAGAQPLMSHTALFTMLFCPENDKQPLYVCTLSFDFVFCVLLVDAGFLDAALAFFFFNGFCTSICVFRFLSVIFCPSLCFSLSLLHALFSFFISFFSSHSLSPEFHFRALSIKRSPYLASLLLSSAFPLLSFALPLAVSRAPPIQPFSLHQYKLRNLLMHSFYTAIASID